jgi:ribosomal protein L7Ae-like RNA K-turn-binding protein
MNTKARQKAASAAPQPHIVNPNDPEWFQYLEKKAVEKYGPRVPPPPGLQPEKKTVGAAVQASAGASFVLHTSEYLKLLKDGEQGKGGDKAKPATSDKMFTKDNLKNDLAAALDSIIKTQQTQPGRKKPAQKDRAGQSTDVLSRIAQMMNKDGAEEKEAEAEAFVTQDDIFLERQNRDEDLAVPCYWSDDEQAPKAVKRASAHHAVGKVPGVRPRQYVTQDLDEYLDHQVAILLLHLRRLGDRQRTLDTPDPASAMVKKEPVSSKRRLVVGLKEVARSVRQGKVKCVVIAPDIEELSATSSGVDERVNEIVMACFKQDTPVVYALSRTRIGRALGKSLRMSALAILDVTGTKDLYEEILEVSYAQRVAWLDKQPKEKQPKAEAPWKAKAAAKAALKAGNTRSL